MSDETRPFWADPAQNTEAYTRPPKLAWRDRTEHHIERIRDTYDATLDWMPAIAATLTLIWLTATFHR